MSDRLAQARAEAERRWPGSNGLRSGDDMASIGDFVRGWLAADANPQPDTLREAQAAAWEEGRASAGILLPTMPPQQPRNPYRRDER